MRLLVIRTSAMGDVAFTTPVISGLLKQYPEAEVLLLTRSSFRSFFTESGRLKLFLPDLRGRHKGLSGIYRLHRDLLETGKIDLVVDIHNVLRSRVLGLLFRMKGIPLTVIDKGRKEKRDLVSGRIRRQLPHSVERYCETFKKAGFPVKTSGGPWIIPSEQALNMVAELIDSSHVIHAGVAPFAKHDLKVWPEEYMTKLLSMIAEGRRVKFWLFGGREDLEKLKVLVSKIGDSQIVAGSLSLDEELALMSRLDFMIAMDSSNMHMAALVGTRVISIWGGTDPLAGFSAFEQPSEYAIRIPVEELTCRPCTIFGKGKCRRGDFACMMWLTPEKVYEQMIKFKIFI